MAGRTGLGRMLEAFFFSLVTRMELSLEEQARFQGWFQVNAKMHGRGVPLSLIFNSFARIAQVTGRPIKPYDYTRVRLHWAQNVGQLDIYIWLGGDCQTRVENLKIENVLLPFANTSIDV